MIDPFEAPNAWLNTVLKFNMNHPGDTLVQLGRELDTFPILFLLPFEEGVKILIRSIYACVVTRPECSLSVRNACVGIEDISSQHIAIFFWSCTN